MNFSNLKKASNYKVEEWLKKAIPELSAYQKSKIWEDEIVRFSPFEFFERRKRVSNIWWRLSVVGVPVVWTILFIGLPFNFIRKGSWGYEPKTLNWYHIWLNNLGL